MMEWLDLELEVLTPAFTSGANQQEAELRSASIRGLLRWSWRAAVGHRYPQRTEDLARAEAELFGSAEYRLKSRVQVMLTGRDLKLMERSQQPPRSRFHYEYHRQHGQAGQADSLTYLAYGPIRPLEKNEKNDDGSAKDPAFNRPDGKARQGPLLIRPAIAPGSKFGVRLAWRRGEIDQGQQDELARAACAWVTLGGIGSRSRKGFGQLDGFIAGGSPEDPVKRSRQLWDGYRKELLRDGKPLPAELPAFPQLEYRKIKTLPGKPTWQDAVGSIGKCYKEVLRGKYLKGDSGWIAGFAREKERRASSVLISIVRLDNQFQPFFCLLPCRKEASPDAPSDRAMRDFASQFPAWDCT